MDRLERCFFNRDTVTVARDLLGMVLVRKWQGKSLTCRITETEAYIGRCDKACHAYGGKRTPRTEPLFYPPGHIYVYLIYGMYHCLNIVTESENEPAAVLIRGIEPVQGLEEMCLLRYQQPYSELTPYQRRNFSNGPGKLCKALNIDKSLNGLDLMGDELYVCRGIPPKKICSGPRIGIDYAEEAIHYPWRFWIDGTGE